MLCTKVPDAARPNAAKNKYMLKKKKKKERNRKRNLWKEQNFAGTLKPKQKRLSPHAISPASHSVSRQMAHGGEGDGQWTLTSALSYTSLSVILSGRGVQLVSLISQPGRSMLPRSLNFSSKDDESQ